MSKRKKRRGKGSTGIVTGASQTGPTTAPSPAGLPSLKAGRPGRRRRWLTFAVLSALVLVGGGLYSAAHYRVWPFDEKEEVLKGTLDEKPPKSMQQAWKELEQEMARRPPQKK